MSTMPFSRSSFGCVCGCCFSSISPRRSGLVGSPAGSRLECVASPLVLLLSSSALDDGGAGSWLLELLLGLPFSVEAVGVGS